MTRNWLTRFSVIGIFSVWLLLSLNTVYAAEFIVGNGKPASCTETALNNAITQANNAYGGIIRFNCGANVVIPITTTKRFTSAGATYVLDGNNQVVLDGQNAVRLLYTRPGMGLSLTVKNIKLNNGNANTDPKAQRAANQGGAIYAGFENTLIVDNVIFRNNTASALSNNTTVNKEFLGGGAIAIDYSSVARITNSRFFNNSSRNGGAINTLLSDVTIENSIFRENSATYNGLGGGGGVYNDSGKLVIRNSFFYLNTTVARGGGLFTAQDYYANFPYIGVASITNSTFANNTASNIGGGIFKSGEYDLKLNQTAIVQNTATLHGGGIAIVNNGVGNLDKMATITNSTISKNNVTSSNGSGGGIFAIDGKATIIKSSTISYNTVTAGSGSSGGGIHSTNAKIRNTIIANNSAGTIGAWGCHGTFVDLGNNILYPNSGNVVEKCSTMRNVNPLLDSFLSPDPSNYVIGGLTPSHALMIPSPAINTGYNCPLIDQRGTGRPQGAVCDIGAYELVGSVPSLFSVISPANESIAKFSTKPATIRMRWSVANGADEYRLKVVNKTSGVVVYNELLTPAQAGCDGIRCTFFTPANYQHRHRYTIEVTAYNIFGTREANKTAFTVKIQQ